MSLPSDKEDRLAKGWLVTGRTYAVRAGLKGLGGSPYYDRDPRTGAVRCVGWLMPSEEAYKAARALIDGEAD